MALMMIGGVALTELVADASELNAVISSPQAIVMPMINFFMCGSVAKIELNFKLNHDKM